MVMCSHNEREVPLALARAAAEAAAKKLKLTPVLEERSRRPWVHSCMMRSPSGRLYSGLGKGDEDESSVGAIYEALEHVFSCPDQIHAEDISVKSFHELNRELRQSHPVRLIMEAQSDQRIACAQYLSLDRTNTKYQHFPLFLSTPHYVWSEYLELRAKLGDRFPYSSVEKYATNSGCASGYSLEEALVHAINELIERDAKSFFLLDTFILHQPRCTIVSKSSLPRDLQQLVGSVETLLSARLVLLSLPNEFDIPCFLAFSKRKGQEIPVTGSGCSLSVRHAISRALTELAQDSVGYPISKEKLRSGRTSQLRRLSQFSEFPNLKKASTLDLSDTLDSLPNYVFPRSSKPWPGSPREHLEDLKDVVLSKGFHIWFREYPLANAVGIGMVHVMIPGLENFQTLIGGSLVSPGERAQKYLTKMSHSMSRSHHEGTQT